MLYLIRMILITLRTLVENAAGKHSEEFEENELFHDMIIKIGNFTFYVTVKR